MKKSTFDFVLGYENLVDRRSLLPTNDDKTDDRRKRDVNSGIGQRYLEVMVVIDHTIISFHGEENTELFVLALFNMVSYVLD